MKKSIDYMNMKRFGGNKEAVIERDNYRCVRCGTTREQHLNIFGCDITVDHIDGQGRNSLNPNNDMNNLQTLCKRCHGSKDGWITGRYATYTVYTEMTIQKVQTIISSSTRIH